VGLLWERGGCEEASCVRGDGDRMLGRVCVCGRLAVCL
jgi:hypothetical protein